MQLEGNVCALTGATGGIGQALAHALTQAGVRLILAGRARATLDELAAARIVAAMHSGERRSAIGWRERWLARTNRTVPALVDRALARQLATIKRFASSATREGIAP